MIRCKRRSYCLLAGKVRIYIATRAAVGGCRTGREMQIGSSLVDNGEKERAAIPPFEMFSNKAFYGFLVLIDFGKLRRSATVAEGGEGAHDKVLPCTGQARQTCEANRESTSD